MADIDVSEVLFDPDLADTFDVIRKAEIVGENGRVTLNETRYPNVVGVVIPIQPTNLQRRDDGQMMPKRMTVVTMFRLRGPSNGYQPDDIIISGVRCTVIDLMPFTRFGAGFVEATVTSMSASNPPEM
jgi:hypothetical protein